MHPALPDRPDDGHAYSSADDVGEFVQGTPFSRWALARYLVGRAVASSVSDALLVVTLVWAGLATAAQWGLGVTWLAVILGLFALSTLTVRWAVNALLRRFTGAREFGAMERRLRSLVSDTHGDVLRELRRLGLPSHTITLPLLAFRLLGKRRTDTVTRLRRFDTERAVPATRVDELHMLLRNAGVAR